MAWIDGAPLMDRPPLIIIIILKNKESRKKKKIKRRDVLESVVYRAGWGRHQTEQICCSSGFNKLKTFIVRKIIKLYNEKRIYNCLIIDFNLKDKGHFTISQFLNAFSPFFSVHHCLLTQVWSTVFCCIVTSNLCIFHFPRDVHANALHMLYTPSAGTKGQLHVSATCFYFILTINKYTTP